MTVNVKFLATLLLYFLCLVSSEDQQAVIETGKLGNAAASRPDLSRAESYPWALSWEY